METFNGIHDRNVCIGEYCVIHNPKPQPLSDSPLHWRSDRNIFERICRHGIGHPDASQLDYWDRIGQTANAVHSCCGCCCITSTNGVHSEDDENT